MWNYFLGLAIALDQLANALIGGDPYELISSRAHRETIDGSQFWTKAEKVIDRLFFWQIAHCERTYRYVIEKIKQQAELYKVF